MLVTVQDMSTVSPTTAVAGDVLSATMTSGADNEIGRTIWLFVSSLSYCELEGSTTRIKNLSPGATAGRKTLRDAE